MSFGGKVVCGSLVYTAFTP
nr:hypothetical protein [Vibrio vulnificus]